MTTVTVQRTASNPAKFSVNIDNVRLTFDASGKATKDVPPGLHILSWTARGLGITFSVKITSPAATGCGAKSPTGGTTLPITAGACEFRTTV